ncbi:unnamed protein product [Didymodactylos carnosus]|uniref:ADP ribosyltransferase domain-containing protein n=1 Tax=Didymodactylos carnosus TaxID=1234261 RepID=A0A814J3U1_9BILA|nr:unnamed protein product [Didymodactylos carnosus]CAF1031932.1 unnamed protein product [Didymodactylos carnosus]CAF3713928.1 unnamed protein product [Didymodactylos carnosus]CAF3802693.1 unnamed protein product [Didymodactylos carnosus]
MASNQDTSQTGNAVVTINIKTICKNKESITLIWFDENIGRNLDDVKKTKKMLREINSMVVFFDERDKCIEHILSIKDELIFLIVSGKSARDILDAARSSRQIDSIFIFCAKIERHLTLRDEYKRIAGVFNKQEDLIRCIRRTLESVHEQLAAFSLFDKKQNSTRDLTQNSASFLWFQLFKNVVLVKMPPTAEAKEQMVRECHNFYRGVDTATRDVVDFAENYKSKDAVEWYTRENFLYHIVNKALRTEDIEGLYMLRFYIANLSSNIVALHATQQLSQITVYRGLKLTRAEIETYKPDSLISTNGFLSTSRSKETAVEFAKKRSRTRTDVEPVLFEIEANKNQSIFADIANMSKYDKEKEVLFDLAATFKITSNQFDATLGLWIICMTSTNEGEKVVEEHKKLIEEELAQTNVHIMFGQLLADMGEFEKSLKYFQTLLQKKDYSRKEEANIYYNIGRAYCCQDNYLSAEENYYRAYEMQMKAKPPRTRDAARSLKGIGIVNKLKGNYDQALQIYSQALKMCENSDIDRARLINNMALVYVKEKKYNDAMKYHRNALEIYKAQLPSHHVYIALCLNSMGDVYDKTKHPDEAL